MAQFHSACVEFDVVWSPATGDLPCRTPEPPVRGALGRTINTKPNAPDNDTEEERASRQFPKPHKKSCAVELICLSD